MPALAHCDRCGCYHQNDCAWAADHNWYSSVSCARLYAHSLLAPRAVSGEGQCAI